MDRQSIVIRLDAADVAAARFEVAPAHELVRVVRALVAPARFPAHRALLREVREKAPRQALATLTQVVTGRGYVPDLLTPPTQDPREIADLVRGTQPDVVRAQLGELLDDGRCDPAVVRRLAEDTSGTVDRLADAMEELWDAALAPLWPAVLDVLRADVRARTATLARSGFGVMVAGLHPTLSWTGEAVVRSSSQYADERAPGQGLVLVPTVFGWPNVQTSTDPARPPTVLYPARNATSDWSRPPGPALAELLGPSRARVLRHLDFPATTSDVAQALDLAVSTAHHHLRVLAAAGLVDRHREGSAVWHLRTELGDALVAR